MYYLDAAAFVLVLDYRDPVDLLILIYKLLICTFYLYVQNKVDSVIR